MSINITNLLKNKNLIAVLISLIVHCLLFASLEIFVANNKKYNAVSVQLVALELPKRETFARSAIVEKFSNNDLSEKNSRNPLMKESLANFRPKESLEDVDNLTKQNTTMDGANLHPSANAEVANFSNSTNNSSSIAHNRSDENKIEELDSVIVNHREIPRYPIFSRRMHEEGTVLLLLSVKNGVVSSVSLEKSSGFPLLDSSAKKAAKKWEFGGDGEFKVKVPFSFKLSN